jgi:23S rRNA A1618 N6-methylase RlmF
VVDTAILSEVITEAEGTFDFCMCNPPFFGTNMEAWGMTNTRTDNRPEHRSSSTASPQESVFPGGEVTFVKQMIEESLVLRDRIR